MIIDVDTYDRAIERQIAHPRHAHQLRHPVHFRRARSAFTRFAIPATGQVVRLGSLDLMNSVEHHHSFGTFGRVILKRPGIRVPAPDLELNRLLAHFISSITCFK